jgi:hypothetical protein
VNGRLAWLAAAMLAGAPLGAAAQPAAAGTELVLREGTRVPMRTVQPLSSKRAQQGQRFDLEVTQDISVGGMRVIPAGSHAVGQVSRVVTKGVMGKRGKLEVKILFVEVGGARIRLDGAASDRGRSGAAPVALAAPLIGVSAGFFTGSSALIPAGSAIDGYVYEDVPLVRPAAVE